jgi:hypothetical protein
MNLTQFLNLALTPVDDRRKGQHFANMLSQHRPDVFQALQGQDLDPFYDDKKLPAAVQFTKTNWDVIILPSSNEDSGVWKTFCATEGL